MDKLRIRGGQKLNGELRIEGAKNAVLPIIAASILIEDEVHISNVPLLRDVQTMLILLTQMGVIFKINNQGQLQLDARALHSSWAPYELVRTMRASILVLGPLLARCGHAKVSLPGGCSIGARPVDSHIRGLEAMGATITIEKGYIHAQASKGLQGADITMPQVSVTGCENLMMAAVLAQGKTIIRNAAREPEIVDLADFLISAGANIQGAGTDCIVIVGVKKLSATHHAVLADRIEAGTYLAAAVMTGGHIKLTAVNPDTLTTTLNAFRQAGADYHCGEDWIELQMLQRPQAVNITTAPYPDFATDMQAQMLAINSIAEGESVVTETIFENRFMHVQELVRMGADIQLAGNHVHCRGVKQLTAAPVMATDLRASACLVLAALVAHGETIIDRVYHIDRGYFQIEQKLTQLGAVIERIA